MLWFISGGGGWKLSQNQTVKIMLISPSNLKVWFIMRSSIFSKRHFGENEIIPLLNYFLNLQWKIQFFTFFILDKNTPIIFYNRNMDLLISNRNQFPTSGRGQTENLPIGPIGILSVWVLPKVKKMIPKADLKWEGSYLYLNVS